MVLYLTRKLSRKARPAGSVLVMLFATWSLYVLMRMESTMDTDLFADFAHNGDAVQYRHSNNRMPDEWCLEHMFDSAMYNTTHYTIPYQLVRETPATYEYDPRLTNGVYMIQLLEKTRSLSDVKLPFSWYDWVDLTELNELIDMEPRAKPHCKYPCGDTTDLSKSRKSPASSKRGGRRHRKTKDGYMKCDDYCEEDLSTDSPGFKVFDLNKLSSESMKRLHVKSYLYSSANLPNSLVFVTGRGNVQVSIDKTKSANMVKSGLLRQFTDRFGDSFNPTELADHFESSMSYGKPLRQIPYRVELEHESFFFDAPHYLKTSNPVTQNQVEFHKALEISLHVQDEKLWKHFHEPMVRTGAPSHYDARFFNGYIGLSEKRQTILSRLLKTWTQLCENADLRTWIAHGALLSHNTNGMSFPWDADIDVQMPFADLAKLAEMYNASVIVEDPKTGYSRYYLDINYSITHRSKGHGLNNIDGRFIDMSSGLYIDITGLAVAPKKIPNRFSELYSTVHVDDIELISDPNIIIDGYYDKFAKERPSRNDNPVPLRALVAEEANDLGEEELEDEMQQLDNGALGKRALKKILTQDQRYSLNYYLQLYTCKNNHFYRLNELSPLRLTYHDKVPVYVPNDVESVLNSEYLRQLKLCMSYGPFTYLAQLRMWIPTKNLRRILRDGRKSKDKNLLTQEDIMGLLDNDEILESFIRSWEAGELHEIERSLLESDRQDKETWLESLIMNKNFKDEMGRDPYLASLMNPHIGKSTQLEQKRQEMKDILHREYTHTIDFGQSEYNYNELETIKDYIKYFQDTGYDIDIDTKIITLTELIVTAKSHRVRSGHERELSKLQAQRAKQERGEPPR